MPPNTESSTIGEPVNEIQRDPNTFIVKYRKDYYDITEFLHKHPGGINTLKGLRNTDMTERFMKAPPHSDAAMYLMKEYQMKGDQLMTQQANGEYTAKNIKENMEIIDDDDYDLDDDDHAKDNGDVASVADKANNNNIKAMDESMEYLVDWSKAMLPQISKITEHYDEWVHKPVDRPLRLFGPWYLEACSKTPWWLVPAFWLPVITKLILDGFREVVIDQDLFKFSLLSVYFLMGILFWTFLEYTLHRYVFHMQTTANTPKWLCTFHFMIHGLHHKVPFDPMRLVFPPLPGVIIASIIYAPLSVLLPRPRIILAGALLGYLCYDMIHYYLHYGSPTVQHLYHMKRYHYQHHFAHQDMGYGISSPLWDFVFNTRINLRKLRYHLKWK